MTTVTVHTPSAVRAPRAAAWAATAFTTFLGWFRQSAEAAAERREVADRAAEAAAVREYAHRFASHDPRFAADLLAAADRHEFAAMKAVQPEYANTQAARSFVDSVLASRHI